MTKTEAVEYGIRWKNAIIDRGDTENSEAVQFLNMAIEALEQELKWIPVTKALPIKGVKVLVQSSYPNLTYVAEIGSFLSQPEGWRTADGYERIEQTVAWMSLPKPYERK